ncbi:hypothetical protein BH09MYX1_BH09MYX1_30040 [soil metagenome]
MRLALRGAIEGDPARHPRVDAVLDGRGLVHHATTEGDTARAALVRAAKALERVRGTTREVGDWKPLVDARCSLVDHFESDGKRFLVAVRNDAPLAGLYDMTLRERQVVGFALLGHPNKVIAYELGIATSTVGVLLGRAMKKLGVKNRAALIAACTPRAA